MKVTIRKSKIYGILMMLVFGVFFSSAQTKSTNEAKVVLILSKKTKEVSGITLLDAENSKNDLPKTYPNHIFYLGMLKGNYEVTNTLIKPLSGSTITVYTDMMLFSEDPFSLLEDINFGEVKTTIISKKKGELILKTL